MCGNFLEDYVLNEWNGKAKGIFTLNLNIRNTQIEV